MKDAVKLFVSTNKWITECEAARAALANDACIAAPQFCDRLP
jgi:hypothetical protein